MDVEFEFAVAVIVAFFFAITSFIAYSKVRNLKQMVEKQSKEYQTLSQTAESQAEELSQATQRIESLARYQEVVDIAAEIEHMQQACQQETERKLAEAENRANRICQKADTEMQTVTQSIAEQRKKLSEDIKLEWSKARETAGKIIETARQDSKIIYDEAHQIRNVTKKDAEQRLVDAELQAKEILGNAYVMATKATELEATVNALKNTIEGYGTAYLKPTYSLLDALADDFSHTTAGKELARVRSEAYRMVTSGVAAQCDYVQDLRKGFAVAFIIDAFNGKVDSILTNVKKWNYGILEKQIKDAYQLVNHNGQAFRNAKITEDYLLIRLEELKWAVRVSELKVKAQEEQRRLREQAREEEKARREYDRAQKNAQKEEEMLHKAMEKARAQMETANEAKRAEYESKLEELTQQLQLAQEKGQRALSMAQQTKRGNVYIISNIGSFGESIYKVGLTRRLNPTDRVKELGDASVPFPFDIHAIIPSDNAPALESELHRALATMQVNKVNPRKEFFKASLSDIRALVEERGLEANWTMAAEAAEYYETLAIEERMGSDPDTKRQWERFASNAIADEETLLTAST